MINGCVYFHNNSGLSCSVSNKVFYFWQVFRKVQEGIRYFDNYVPEVIYLLCLTTFSNSGFNKQIILKSNNEHNRGYWNKRILMENHEWNNVNPVAMASCSNEFS